MAVARRLPQSVEPIVLTTSQAVAAAREQGFHVEHFPPLGRGADAEERSSWNVRMAKRVESVLREYEPSVVVFDGTYPYHGVIHPVWRASNVTFLWCRRGLWSPGKGEASLTLSWAFDKIIEPGELTTSEGGRASVDGRPETIDVPPIVMLEESELLGRSAAESALGLAAGHTNVLIQLGAGNINDTGSPTALCVERLAGEKDLQLAVAQSPIAGHELDLPGDVHSLRAYPISRFYRAFDFVISAAGYNSFHELIALAVPTLYVPNRSTGVDDQLARARYAERIGVARLWDGVDVDRLDQCLRELLDVEVRERMRGRAHDQRFDNGAVAAALLVADLSAAKRARIARTIGRGAYLAAVHAARSAYLRLLSWLPARAAEGLREGAWRFRGRGSRPRAVASAPVSPRSMGGGEVELVCLAVGVKQGQLGELIEDVTLRTSRGPAGVLFVTDCAAFPLFSGRGHRFEYIPPRGEWDKRSFSSDYDSFLNRRIDEIAEAYGVNRTLDCTRRSHSGGFGSEG
jgi:Glycosyltransferase family 28 C-terminal domain